MKTKFITHSMVSITKLESQNNLIGLVLCGGKSTRMQTDKAFMVYHDQPQAYYLYNQLQPFCNHVFLSCNQNQLEQVNPLYKTIVDQEKFNNCGPISGLLSAMETAQNKSLLVLACDYPLFTINDILNLITLWKNEQQSVSFFNPETNFREPLLAIYHQNDLQKLKEFYAQGNSGLQHFLNEINAIKLTASSYKNITSIDTKVAFETIHKQLNNQ